MNKVSQKEFLDGCKRYHEIEPRAITYPIAYLLVNKNCITEGVRLLLASWNNRYVQRFKNDKLVDDIEEVWEETKDDIKNLRGKRFENLELSAQNEDALKIDHVFWEWSSRESISDVGAAKALGLLCPSVFVMWDNNIAKKYKINIHYEPKTFNKPSTYIGFLRKVQERFKPLLSECSPQDLWEKHCLELREEDRSFYYKISFVETFPKMIDEFNYSEAKKVA
jgi:hypothetical protein